MTGIISPESFSKDEKEQFIDILLAVIQGQKNDLVDKGVISIDSKSGLQLEFESAVASCSDDKFAAALKVVNNNRWKIKDRKLVLDQFDFLISV